MIETYARFLTDDQVERVHQASLEILQETGLLIRNDKARKRLIDHGCLPQRDSKTVTFPSELVETNLALVPPTFTIYGRDPKYDVTFPRGIPLIITASSAPDIVDPISGITRRANSEDIARIGHMLNELEGFDVMSISVLADDAPEGQFSLSRFYPAVKNCLKPVRTSVIDEREAKQVLKLGELIAGSEQAYRERPFITFGHCPIVSPLTMDFDSTEMLMYFAENEIPSYGTIAPIGGLSTPLTLPGMLALMNAEWLAMMVLTQISRAGTQMIYNFLPVFADMRDGAYAPGGIETGIMNSAVCQMGRHYNVPVGGYLGLTNSKVCDAQSGFEKTMSPMIGTLSGVDYIVTGGLQDALMTFDYAQLVIDNETALMLKRVVRGMEFSEQALALDEIKKVGPADIFVGEPNTLELMTTTTFMPELADRDPREKWEFDGSRNIRDRAMDKAREILTRPNTGALSPEIDARVRAGFGDLISEELVAGDSIAPEGWTPPEPKRGKRVSRRRRAA